jgi:mannosyltransferase
MHQSTEPANGGVTAARGFRPGVLAAILVVALALRVWGLQAQSFTMDEVSELRIAKESPAAIIVESDGFPPFYHLLLHRWLPVFGGDSSARWLSVVCGLVTVWAMWRLGRLIGGTAVGLIAAALLATSPIHVYYSQEARAYALFFLLAVIAIWLFLRARSSDTPRDWTWFGAASVLGLYTHYYFLLLLPALILTVPLERDRYPIRRMALSYAALALLALPWAWLAWQDLKVQTTSQDLQPTLDLGGLAYTLVVFLGGYSAGPSLRELHDTDAAHAALEVLPWAAPLGLAAFYLGYRALTDRSQWRSALRLLVIGAVPLALCGILGTLLAVGYRVRYVSWGAAPFLALLSLGVVRGWGRRATVTATGVLTVLSLVSIFRRHSEPRYMNEDSRAAAQWLASNADQSGPVFVTAGYMAEPVSYYLGRSRDLQALPAVTTSTDLESALGRIRKKTGAGPFWLVYSRPFHGDPKGILLLGLKNRAQLALRATFPGIELYQGQDFRLARPSLTRP